MKKLCYKSLCGSFYKDRVQSFIARDTEVTDSLQNLALGKLDLISFSSVI